MQEHGFDEKNPTWQQFNALNTHVYVDRVHTSTTKTGPINWLPATYAISEGIGGGISLCCRTCDALSIPNCSGANLRARRENRSTNKLLRGWKRNTLKRADACMPTIQHDEFYDLRWFHWYPQVDSCHDCMCISGAFHWYPQVDSGHDCMLISGEHFGPAS